MRQLLSYSKNPETDLIKHHNTLKSYVEVVKQFGDIGEFPVIQRADESIGTLKSKFDALLRTKSKGAVVDAKF